MQEIMDEELAIQLQRQLQAADIEDKAPADKGGDWSAFGEPAVVFRTSPRKLLSADDYDVRDDDDQDDLYDSDEEYIARSQGRNVTGTVAPTTALRETLRRQAKEENHKREPPNVDLGKYARRDRTFDERTQLMLQKLISTDKIRVVQERVHAGREANVYHAIGYADADAERERSLALKIFKTARSDFTKVNECDPTGRRYDVRFVKKSMRRQLKLWAEKEYKHLCRATQAGVRAPQPYLLQEHIILMEFVGSEDGVAAPQIRNVELNRSQLADAYRSVLRSMRQLYQVARLVHGKLNECTILYHNDQVYLNDFGHAIERSNPEHEEALDRDLESVHDFFLRRGLHTANPGEGTRRQLRRAADTAPGMLTFDGAKQFVVTESLEGILRGYPAMKAFVM